MVSISKACGKTSHQESASPGPQQVQGWESFLFCSLAVLSFQHRSARVRLLMQPSL